MNGIQKAASTGFDRSRLRTFRRLGRAPPLFGTTIMTSTTAIPSPAPQTAPGSARSWLASGLQPWFDRLAKRQQMKMLLGCDDRVLNDIGVSRAEVWARLHGRI